MCLKHLCYLQRYYDMLLTDIHCEFANETINGSCSIDGTNTLDLQAFNFNETIIDLHIRYKLTAHLDNGTDVFLGETKFDFCTLNTKTHTFPIVHVIFRYLKLVATSFPQSCPIEKV